MESIGYLDRKFMDDRTAGACIPLAMAGSLIIGPENGAAMAALLALVGWMNKGKIRSLSWLFLGAAGAVSMLWHKSFGSWTGMLLLYAAASLLYQSLGHKGKMRSKAWCLNIAAAVAVLVGADIYMEKAGCLGAGYISSFAGLFPGADAAGLFFATAILSDSSVRRRYLSCVALGLCGSPMGLLCLGTGLLFKRRDWVEDMLWTGVGLSLYLLPANLWFLLAAFLFWCIPEVLSCIGRPSEKWGWIPFAAYIGNPWMLGALDGWLASTGEMLKGMGWHLIMGAGPSDELLAGGFIQVMSQLGLMAALPLLVCTMHLYRKPSGYAWTVNLSLGAGAFVPGPFLLGTGTGMSDTYKGREMEGRWFFFAILAASLYLCAQSNI